MGSGGAQRQLVNLALWLKVKGHEVSFLTYFYKDFYLETLREAEVPHTCIPIKNPLSRIIKFRRFIRSGNYDVVIAFLGIPAFLAEMAAIPFKRWTLIIGERSANPSILKSAKSRFLRFFHLFADHVVANSQTNMDMVKKVNSFLPDKKCHVIYNAIDLEKYQPLNGFQFKKENRLKIIVPASYRRLKNLLGLIEAVNLLSEEEKRTIKIDWYGSRGPNTNPDFILHKAEKRIEELKLSSTFTLNPATNNLHIKIQQADLLGLFSFFEGLPNSVCEGMACGKPILAASVSDIPSLIEDEVGGKLFKPDDPNSIAEAIRIFIRCNPTELIQMGQVNRVKAKALFNPEEIFFQYFQLFNNQLIQ